MEVTCILQQKLPIKYCKIIIHHSGSTQVQNVLQSLVQYADKTSTNNMERIQEHPDNPITNDRLSRRKRSDEEETQNTLDQLQTGMSSFSIFIQPIVSCEMYCPLKPDKNTDVMVISTMENSVHFMFYQFLFSSK